MTTKGKFLGADKSKKVYVFREECYPTLRIEDSYIEQPNKYLRSEEGVNYPCYVSLSFDYKAITNGTIEVTMNNGLQDTVKDSQSIEVYPDYHVFRTSFLWNGLGDLRISYSGTINIRLISVRIDSIRSFEYKYQELFDHSDILVKMAKEYIKNDNT